MNFTREPIIETIITPKDGYKLTVRNSKGAGEEYSVDALEVVSFGSAIFYRSVDRAKSFLLPVADFEVVEVKETRMVLKSVAIEKSVKIAGGKEATQKAAKESVAEAKAESQPLPKEKKERRRTRRRRGAPLPEESTSQEEGKAGPSPSAEEGGGREDETRVSSSIFSGLLRPPPGLISEKIKRVKDQEVAQGDLFPEVVEKVVPLVEEPKEEKEAPPEELTPEREKNQPLFPSFQEEEPEKFPVPMEEASEEENLTPAPPSPENDDYVF